ncbi:TRAP transporter small permease [Paracoccus sp. Z330]|uniref:TRAP transporter small permease protein n=1 Tax=Paracoccus onchidii TaxID=3017813 RepID=A0ABT4ZHJ6_9RHOB|nr:TRAP transporter small permease [Paracoccus onchidii]MDB6178201.1 TRAP transporter small permease [Paracoccus onchidii]
MMAKLATGVSRLNLIVGRMCGMFYAAAVLLAVFEVFSRYVLDAPTVWSSEIVLALCGTAWILSAGPVSRQNRHITVTVLELVLGARVWRMLQRIALAITTLAVMGLLYASHIPFLRTLSHMERSGSAFNPPLPSYLRVMLMIGLTLYLAQTLVALFSPLPPAAADTPQEGD